MSRHGVATFRQRRVTVRVDEVGTTPPGTIRIVDEVDRLTGLDVVPNDPTYGFSREPWAVATVPVDELEDLVVIEDRACETAAIAPDDAGAFAVIDGVPRRLVNTSGFLRDGQPMLQLVEAGPSSPAAGFDWVRTGDSWVAAVERSVVETIEIRRIRAIWRGVEVRADRVSGGSALVSSRTSRPPAPAARLAHGDYAEIRSFGDWSADVEVADLEGLVREVRAMPPSPAAFPWPVGQLGGRFVQMAVAEIDPWEAPALAVVVDGELPGPGMTAYSARRERPGAPLWRRFLPASELGSISRVTTEASVAGVWVEVSAVDAETWRTFDVVGAEIPFGTIEQFRYRETPIEADALPQLATRRSYVDAL
ncbi:hypothetical protein ACGGZK_08350 [Agromyces sp. MMS24-K17]|uniref:hypothetical protein n=1 Tax=Agromyces sp. MMS24-K17 TaxID=3372850 RepID=UPI003754D7E2